MPITFDEEYFTNSNIGYINYRDDIRFYNRAKWLSELGYNHITVIGCAYGFTVKHLIDDFNFTNVKGVEKSAWAMTKGTEMGLLGYIFPSDISLYNYANTDLIVSWNVLDTMASDIEVEILSSHLNSSEKTQIHVLSMADSANTQDYIDMGYLMRSYEFWRSMFPDAYLVCSECRKVYNPEGKEPLHSVPLIKDWVAD